MVAKFGFIVLLLLVGAFAAVPAEDEGGIIDLLSLQEADHPKHALENNPNQPVVPAKNRADVINVLSIQESDVPAEALEHSPNQPVQDDLAMFFVNPEERPDLSYQATNRIVGGSKAAEGSAPYMVALTNGWLFKALLCGGSLISERHVLTAAHCIEAVYSRGSLSRNLRVTVGTNRWSGGGLTYRLARNVTHQNYSSSLIKNDIGLLITTTYVSLSKNVAPVALSGDFVGAGVEAQAAGWGRTRRNGPISADLLELVVKTLDGQECVDEVKRLAETTNMQAPHVEPQLELCVFHSPGRGMCNGDSGSALVSVQNKTQIGVVSWGFPCALGAPDVFTRVSAYKSWVEENL